VTTRMRKFPWVRRGLKGEPLIPVHGLQGMVDRADSLPSWFTRDS
jgi:hypothetical protein